MLKGRQHPGSNAIGPTCPHSPLYCILMAARPLWPSCLSPPSPHPSQLPGFSPSGTCGTTHFLPRLSRKNGVIFLVRESIALPSDPALTAFCLLLTLLPSFCHVLLSPPNKSGPAFLFLTNCERADCQRGARCLLGSGGGGRGRECSSWAVGAAHSTPLGQLQVSQMASLVCSFPLAASVHVPPSSLSPSRAR